MQLLKIPTYPKYVLTLQRWPHQHPCRPWLVIYNPPKFYSSGSVSKPWSLVNPKIAGKWMFIPLKMVCIGIDPYPSAKSKSKKKNTSSNPWPETAGDQPRHLRGVVHLLKAHLGPQNPLDLVASWAMDDIKICVYIYIYIICVCIPMYIYI